MSRPRCLLVLLALLAAGCGWVPKDEQAIRTFFAQSSLYDRTRLADVAQVVFDPRVEGVVDRFDVVSRNDTTGNDGRLHRVAQVDAVVRSSRGRAHRTIFLTLEQAATGRWMITAYR